MPTKKFEKGRKKTGGRQKGTRNKFTSLKETFMNAFNSEEMGGEKGLIDAYKSNNFTKREFYKLISRMLPTNVSVEGDVKVTYQLSDKFIPKKDDQKKK